MATAMRDLKLLKRSIETEATFNPDADDGILEGVPIVFEQPTVIHTPDGDYNEIISRHALDGCDLSDVLLCINHDDSRVPLARTRKGTMELTIMDDGVHMRAHLDVVNNPEARQVYTSIKRGDMAGMSFAFRPAHMSWSDVLGEPTCVIDDIAIVHEVSVVSRPAYPQTTVSARAESEDDGSALVEAREKAKAEEAARQQEELDAARAKLKARLEAILNA